MKKREWLRVEVTCGAGAADHVASEIAEAFSIGVEIGETSIRFYLQGDRFPKGWESKLRRVLGDLKEAWYPEADMTYSCSPLPEEDWATSWKAHFKPIRVGKHFIISPTWEEVNPGVLDRLILLDPGQAFGTGHHETTRLCLEWLEEWEAAERELNSLSLLDVGTGSGILAIAAALMGFHRVVAVDHDPEAIRVARENVALNRVEDKVRILEGTVPDAPGSYSVILANIQAVPLIELAAPLTRLLKSNGRLILSGILVEQKDAVISAYEKEGLKFLDDKNAGEWCLLAFSD